MSRQQPEARRPDPDELDGKLAALTLQLENILISFASATPEERVIADAYTDEFLSQISLTEDMKLACLLEPVNGNANLIAEITRREGQAADARRLQLGIRTSALGNARAPVIKRPTSPSTISFVTADEDGLRNEKEVEENRLHCISCSELFHFHDGVQLSCSHFYCVACLKNFFNAATKDLTLFHEGGRLHCCGQYIPLDLISEHMDETELGTFLDAEVLSQTEKPVHCSNPYCSKFIRPDRIQAGAARCRHCDSVTCASCRKEMHPGDCPDDEDLQAILRLAAEKGYRRCYNCGTMVELSTGCYHITCKCRAEFCYLCGEPWKTCLCVQWDEERLVDRAQDIVERQRHQHGNLPGSGDDEAIQQRVNQVRQDLIDRHNCTHNVWFQKHTVNGGLGGYTCGLCGSVRHRHIFECPLCHELICEGCRLHRLPTRDSTGLLHD